MYSVLDFFRSSLCTIFLSKYTCGIYALCIVYMFVCIILVLIVLYLHSVSNMCIMYSTNRVNSLHSILSLSLIRGLIFLDENSIEPRVLILF